MSFTLIKNIHDMVIEIRNSKWETILFKRTIFLTPDNQSIYHTALHEPSQNIKSFHLGGGILRETLRELMTMSLNITKYYGDVEIIPTLRHPFSDVYNSYILSYWKYGALVKFVGVPLNLFSYIIESSYNLDKVLFIWSKRPLVYKGQITQI